jgi:transglutaminase-like putative cysteine protease
MKYRFAILCLALTLLLTGCGLRTNQYHSVKDHVDSYTEPAEEEIKVNSYEELQKALMALIGEGVEESTLTTDVYSGDIEQDFDRAVYSITHDYPADAYLVSAVQKEIVSAGSYYRIDLRIFYRHQPSELDGIEPIYYTEKLQYYLKEALRSSQRTLTLHMINYVDMDFNQMVEEYCDSNLTEIIAKPDRVIKETYPASGSERYLELRFEYPEDDKTLAFRRQFVEYMMATAKESVAGEASELERARKLYAYLMGSGHSFTEESAPTPAFALFYDHKADCHSFSAIYEIMCKSSAVNCTTVHGTKNGEPYDWNILELDSGVWHVDVNADAQSGQPELRLLTDADMGGYEWDTSATPACVGFFEPEPPPQEEGETEEDPEQTENPAPEQEPGPEPSEENPNEPENTP